MLLKFEALGIKNSFKKKPHTFKLNFQNPLTEWNCDEGEDEAKKGRVLQRMKKRKQISFTRSVQ
jgi:hypothetical protein